VTSKLEHLNVEQISKLVPEGLMTDEVKKGFKAAGVA
jgi:hypothetical protein